jgi:hypothetical protein
MFAHQITARIEKSSETDPKDVPERPIFNAAGSLKVLSVPLWNCLRPELRDGARAILQTGWTGVA